MIVALIIAALLIYGLGFLWLCSRPGATYVGEPPSKLLIGLRRAALGIRIMSIALGGLIPAARKTTETFRAFEESQRRLPPAAQQMQDAINQARGLK